MIIDYIENEDNFTGYTVTISDDPAYYDLGRHELWAEERTQEIVSDVTSLIERQFPGCRVVADANKVHDSGPDDEVLEQIQQWVGDNWTSAL
jgi:hypothetical protein